MSIKGTSQELYVGKKESNIISFWGNKRKIEYDDLKYIDYMYASGTEIGYFIFVGCDNQKIRFEFAKNVNEKISRTIDLIKENAENLEIREQRTDDLKFYQRNLFTIIISFVLGFPLGLIGLYLMWYYKKSHRTARLLVTFMAFLFWGTCGYLSYMNYKSAVNKASVALENYQNTLNSIYPDTGLNTQSAQSEIQDTTSVNKEETSKEQESTSFSVGDVYESGGIKIMFLNSGDYSVENQFMQPESGNKYIFAEFSIENTGESDLSTGSFLFDCYADNTECKQPIVSGEDMLTSITSLSSGKNTKGKIFFEVPNDAEKIQLEYKIDALTDKKIYFNIK